MTSHIRFDSAANALVLLDQRKLPLREEFLACSTSEDVIRAIRTMAVRGAPAIGVAAAWGCFMAANELRDCADWQNELQKRYAEIGAARPTAVNLAWAVNRMAEIANSPAQRPPLAELHSEAARIQTEDIEICKAIGANGAPLIQDGDTVLTHCNAGSLATAGYGTALGVIRAAAAEGKKIKVIADETRPLLQGARLTAWELHKEGIPVAIACDNACALLLGKGMVNLIITGADRIAANGDTANKIGTCGAAIIASHFRIPFYIAAPLSTIDLKAETGAEIPVEERSQEEVLEFAGARIAPEGVRALNFAFDITPAPLISGIVTEAAILRPPYEAAIRKAMRQAAHG
ncbi:MAG: S-methyl-5-thioribose-1-phosphate isomerase [Desulfovibrio sp.]|nr:S-methyl-5-thioribose-1-phosphate isomerase [Desulfovibrio sp.]